MQHHVRYAEFNCTAIALALAFAVAAQGLDRPCGFLILQIRCHLSTAAGADAWTGRGRTRRTPHDAVAFSWVLTERSRNPGSLDGLGANKVAATDSLEAPAPTGPGPPQASPTTRTRLTASCASPIEPCARKSAGSFDDDTTWLLESSALPVTPANRVPVADNTLSRPRPDFSSVLSVSQIHWPLHHPEPSGTGLASSGILHNTTPTPTPTRSFHSLRARLFDGCRQMNLQHRLAILSITVSCIPPASVPCFRFRYRFHARERKSRCLVAPISYPFQH
jgi:hypothetical protein